MCWLVHLLQTKQFDYQILYIIVLSVTNGTTRAVPGGVHRAMAPPPIGQDFKANMATFWPAFRASSIRGPPQSKILEPPMRHDMTLKDACTKKEYTLGHRLKGGEEYWQNF